MTTDWPFDTVLIANRGEVAVRIQRTVLDLGLRPVAVYSDADRGAPHVVDAAAAVRLGPGPAAESYLRAEAVVEAALATGAGAVHPGYGLLAESAPFARACAEAGIRFVGPTPAQIEAFGAKHSARVLARTAGVPVVPGTGLLGSDEEAVAAAESLGWPVMVKASAGGGGIGMRRVDGPDELVEALGAVRRLAVNNFGSADVYLERHLTAARHVEVQVFGDGTGRVVTLGDRDCSVQRRNQKLIEETPAPDLDDDLRRRLADHAVALASSVDYRSAGTVEFVVDAGVDTPGPGDAWFLEMNTRLQVEHGVTEATHGIDLVAWMLRLAADDPLPELDTPPTPVGAAIEARICAEDGGDGFRPSSGLLTGVAWPDPDQARVDTWIAAGTEVTPFYDSLLAKVIVTAPDRAGALDRLDRALAATAIGGIETNVGLLRRVLADDRFRAGRFTTTDTATVTADDPGTIRVVEAGMFSTIQDLPGRIGYWQVGVPPSGPMDDRSFSLVNELVGNEAGAPGLELTVGGPTLRFASATRLALGGAELAADLDGSPVPWWTVIEAPPGATLRLGGLTGPGFRAYLAVAGGFDVPDHLGSASTFVLGGFGGHGGRTLRPGDVLRLRTPAPHQDPTPGPDPGRGRAPGPGREPDPVPGSSVPVGDRPVLTRDWEVGVITGPHGSPDFFTPEDTARLHDTAWEVHFNSDRTGVRLIGPAPTWARDDGGEAGLHPSNIHDTPYAIGAVDFTGDMPIVLGRDGPSLGGFVCPATVVSSELWKIGQAAPGDRIRFVPVDPDLARYRSVVLDRGRRPGDPVLARLDGDDTGDRPAVTYRRSGERRLLVEYGDNVLDLLLRLRAGALMDHLLAHPPPGLGEVVPGIRSLQIEFDPDRWSAGALVDHLLAVEDDLPPAHDLELPSRVVHLPLSWDDPATRLATEKYLSTVRPDAPWGPWNLEFIRRINGLGSVEAVRDIVFAADYLVLGLGDVYLGAPVATPVDPRHRLVTTKYNPARTWTAENSVGIGGAYLCIYGMEGPGGYQFVGRTVQVWNRWRHGRPGGAFAVPWLLRFFDRIRWYPVGADELLDLRADVAADRFRFRITDDTFRVADHLASLAADRDGIAAFAATRDAAFAAERARWAEAGIDVGSGDAPAPASGGDGDVPPGSVGVTAPLPGMVWRCLVEPGQPVDEGDVVLIVETMKMETEVVTAAGGTVTEVRCPVGSAVAAGQVVVVVDPGVGR